MQMGPDVGPYNVGPLWIWSNMEYNSNSDKTLVTIRSIMMKTSVDFIIGASAGFHYCKVLSPARALEWIQTDSLYARGGLSSSSSSAANGLTVGDDGLLAPARIQ